MLGNTKCVVLIALFFLNCVLQVSAFLPSPAHFATYNQVQHISTELSALKTESDKDMLKFGNTMNIDIRLPTKDRELVAQFLNDTEYIVESSWEKTKIKKVSPNTYLLQFLAIPIPGVDVVTPEIKVRFENVDGVVVMESGEWSLKGESGNILKDSGFMKSFDIQLKGELGMSNVDPSNPLVSTIGKVSYEVKGAKPKVFKRAPNILLQGTINFIQKRTADYVNKRFTARFAKAFREYLE